MKSNDATLFVVLTPFQMRWPELVAAFKRWGVRVVEQQPCQSD